MVLGLLWRKHGLLQVWRVVVVVIYASLAAITCVVCMCFSSQAGC